MVPGAGLLITAILAVPFSLIGWVQGAFVGGLAGLCVTGLQLLAGIARYLNSEFAITSRRVIARTGFLHLRSFELLLEKVEGVAVDEPFLGRLLGYGTVVVSGTGASKEGFTKLLHFLKEPNDQAA
jgi:uncharacterized membrane protein YdbT with pleckstrin-like domain